MTTTVSNLPWDLVEEILTRVPSKSMRAVRLTCKKWNALSKNQSFRKMHFDREEAVARELGEYPMIVMMMMDNNISLMSAFVDENPSTEFKGELTCLNDSEKVKISQVFHCEGLLLCILKNDDTRVMVWNPYLGQTRWIKNINYDRTAGGRERYMYALGYKNKSCLSHKILTFIEDFQRYDLPCGIYDFDSDLWRNLDVTQDWRIPSHDHGVSLKGNTYWCATDRNSYFCGLIDSIICFDFTRERFGPLLPLPFRAMKYDFPILSCVREEKLAALWEDRNTTIEIWITTKIEAEKVSWSKFLSVDTRPPNEKWLFSGSLFINEEKKVAMVLGKSKNGWLDTVNVFGEDGYLDFGEPSEKLCWTCVCSYVPSLVQIKQPERGHRKKNKAPQMNNKARNKWKR